MAKQKIFRKVLTAALALTVASGTGAFAVNGNIALETPGTLAVSAATLPTDNGSYLSSTSLTTANTGLTAYAKFKGGEGIYRYAYSYKKDGGDWVKVTVDTTSAKSQKITLPRRAGFYTIRIAVWDSRDHYASKYLNVTVKNKTGKAFSGNSSSLSSSSTWAKWTITANANFTGGTEPYQYKYSYKNDGGSWRDVTSYVTNQNQKITLPDEPGFYTVRVAAIDADGNYQSKYLDLTVKKNTNISFHEFRSTLSSNSTWAGWTITANADFSGGTQPYTYKYSYRLGNGSWTDVTKNYVKNASQKIKMPSTAGYYTIRIAAKDAVGNYQSTYRYIPVNKDTKKTFKDNGSNLSTTSTWVNWTVTANAKFTGGAEPYKYKYSYRLENGSWTDVSSSYSYTAKSQKIKMPSTPGNYTVRIAAIDGKGKYLSKYINLKVKQDTKLPFKDNGSDLSSKLRFVNSDVSVYADFTGGVKPYTYKIDYKQSNGSWKTVKNYSSVSETSFKLPSQPGTYAVRIAAKDANGTYQSKYINVTVVSDKPSIGSDKMEMLELINRARSNSGVSTVTLDNELTVAANIRAKETTQLFSVQRPDGREWYTVLYELGLVSYAQTAGTNIIEDCSSPSTAMNSWLSSRSGEEPITYPSFTKVGIGRYKNNWVLIFR